MTTNDSHNSTVTDDIAEILSAYGELFHGGRPDEVAAEWVEAGVTDLDAVNGWCMANVWEPRVAAKLRAAHVSPQMLCGAAARMTRGMSADEMRDRWTEGCPIYAACNGDISVDDLIAAVWESDEEGDFADARVATTEDRDITDSQIERLAAEAAEAGDIMGSAIACRAIGRDYSDHDLTPGERTSVESMTAEECRLRCERQING